MQIDGRQGVSVVAHRAVRACRAAEARRAMLPRAWQLPGSRACGLHALGVVTQLRSMLFHKNADDKTHVAFHAAQCTLMPRAVLMKLASPTQQMGGTH